MAGNTDKTRRTAALPLALALASLFASPAWNTEFSDPRVIILNKEVRAVSDGERPEYNRARDQLAFCAQQHSMVGWDDLVGICTAAQRKVDECNAYRADWARRRAEALDDLPSDIGKTRTDRLVVKDDTGNPLLDPKTGKPITEARSEVRGVGAQPDQEQRRSDAVYMLRNTYLKECPSTVPGVSRDGYSLTPAAALEYWKEQDNKPLPGAAIPRRATGATPTVLLAAVDKANEQGAIRDAEEAEAEKERIRLAALKAEQDRLAQIAADKAAKERAAQIAANEAAEQAAEQAEAARQARIAAQAARAAKASSVRSNATNNTASTRTVSGPTACSRNNDQFTANWDASGVKMYGATYDLFWAEINKEMMKIWQPCMSFSKEAQENYTYYADRVSRTQNYCSGPHEAWQCQPWGSAEHQQDHMNALQWTRAEVQRLVGGSGPAAQTSIASARGAGRLDHTTETSGQDGDDQDAATCREAVREAREEGEAINARKPANASTVATMQVGLYVIRRSLQALDKSCRGRPEYGQYNTLKRTYDQTMTTCTQIASAASYCTPRIAW